MKKIDLMWLGIALGPPILAVLLINGSEALFEAGPLGPWWASLKPVLLLLPVLFFAANGLVSAFFQASRLAYISFFLMLTYGYLLLPWMGIGLEPGEGFGLWIQGSYDYLTLLIPLNILIIHFQPDHGLRSTRALKTSGVLAGQFVVLAVVYGLIPEAATQFYETVFLAVLPGIDVRFAWATVLLLTFGAVLFHYPDRTSFYHLRNTVIFWVMLTVTLGFFPELQLFGEGGFPVHHVVFFGVASLMLVPKTVHYIWLKVYYDPLTLLPARLSLEERFTTLPPRFSLVMVDIDQFKEFNDTYGPDSGLTVLSRVAEVIERNASGEVYRFGSDQFTVLYPHESTEELEDELEVIRLEIRNLTVQVTKKSQRATKLYEPTITVSLGASGREPGDELTPHDVLERADRALDRAKQAGRNQLVIDG